MKRNSFKKVLALLTVLVMTLGVVAVPNVSAKADDAANGEINYINGYDWTGSSTSIHAFASASAEASPASMCAQGDAFLDWFYGIVLERNADYNYVVTAAQAGQADNTIDATTLGEGKIVIMFHGDAQAAHADSYNFFMSLQVNDVLAASTYWEAIAATAGAPATALTFAPATAGSVGPKAPTKGALDVVNGLGAESEIGTKIVLLAPNDANVTVTTMTAGTPLEGLGYWYSILLEKNATKGTWVVTSADLVAGDGVNSHATEPLGEGKMLVLIHDTVTDVESAAFFKGNAQEGKEFYLVGELPATGNLSGVYLTTEAPAPAPAPVPQPGGITNTGDNFALMVVVLFAGVAMIAAATIAKKRNA